MTKDKALKLAMEFVASISPAFICEATHHKKNEEHASNEPCPHVKKQKQTYEAIKEALAESEQEPVGWLDSNDKLAEFMHKDLKAEHDKRDSSTPRAFQIPLYTTPPQRTWIGLTDEEVMEIAFNFDVPSLVVRTAEAKLKEKNTP
ncbi:hypothetical protein UFOVP272_41 [uncultured Caudovirales phage]|uniref:Uncharacterized protein n=1 Tax=uncultured Caudovirales phage TaxID=2100421 RepID=A0A6J5LJC8_9CAUD|nr:hypothetical protein UFOVP272_41 [uncultured Caudovirales phage]